MDDGVTTTTLLPDSMENVISKQISTLSCNDEQEDQTSKKDPTRIARKYQMELCEKALNENVIVYMGTGCGKTHIAVLLIYKMGHLIKKPQKNICIFLAPTVALVQQQAKVIENSVDFKVSICCGNSTNLMRRHYWEKEMEQHEVFVMTPQILLHYLSHCFIKIELIALLIFDECHYAQIESNHPYAEIMKIFYKMDLVKLPRIFGMTASPKLGKGGSIDGLEALLRAKVHSVEDKDELEQFVTSPKVNMYYFDSSENRHQMTYIRKLEEIKHQCTSAFRMNMIDQNSTRSTKKSLMKLHCNLKFCLENLGLWGALQASNIYLKGDHHENIDLVEAKENCSDDKISNQYLQQAALVLASDCARDGTKADLSCVEVLKEPFFSRKLVRLIDILSSFRLQPNMKCIIFVNRIVTARSLTYILRNLKFLSSWKCGFLVGVHAGLVSRKNTNIILEKFRAGELNLLVATKVGEEGLDIQTCCLVIRFDIPETVASFIQSRGRARMPQSEYAFLVDRGNPNELKLIEHFKKDEAQMNEEISTRSSHVPTNDFEEPTYKVDSTRATLSSVQSISLLHRYCSRLSHDEYFNPRPEFSYDDTGDGMVCNIILPANAPIHEVVSIPQPSTEAAKRDACLKACKSLHEIGALADDLLPEQDNNYKDTELSDSDICEDEDSRTELHEMLVPASLRVPWTEEENYTCFRSYYFEFCPDPADRIYKKFALFVKDSLPEEAGKMKLEICLARGRMVTAQLIPCGAARFNKDEIASAEKFQKLFLKIILDRQEFVPEYVSLEDDNVSKSNSPTFYLLLPVIHHDYAKISVEWTLIKRCLSSPIFSHPGISTNISQPENNLHLANGCKSVPDIVNSLVYVPCKHTFFFISDIIPAKNGYSSYDESKSHMEHFKERFDIHLVYPDQPLLKAKQLFVLDNLLRKKRHSGEWREKVEHFIELPPEICQLKIIGFSKDIGSTLYLLPSIMHRLENFLVAIELKDKLVASIPEAKEVTANRILEALTTERCSEHFSLERLEVLGDAFLKFAVGRHLFLKHDTLDEGQLTRKRSNIVNNSNLLKLATRKNLQVYIRDQSFEANQLFAFGRPCPQTCTKDNEKIIHPQYDDNKNDANVGTRCNKCHHWLHKKTIADVVESLTGAFIVDSGFKAATVFLRWLDIHVDFKPSQIDNICSASKSFLPLADQMDVNALESILKYDFAHKGLLIQAFIHPSFNKHSGGCYQRLEFLGDAVLDYLITSYLYSVYPKLKPGQLTDLRSVSVNNISFAEVAGRRSFDKFIICESNVLRNSINKYVSEIGTSTSVKGHMEEKACPKVLGDLVESTMGALFLDTGFNLHQAWNMMLSLLDPIICSSKLHFNPLRDLQELCQSYNWNLQFSSLKKDGKYVVEAKVDEGKVFFTASSANISGKAAKRIASRQVYELMKAKGYKSKTISLQEVLQKSEKKEAQLIGYDEASSHETPKSGSVEVLKTCQSGCDLKELPHNKKSPSNSAPIKRLSFPSAASENQQTILRNGSSVNDSLAIQFNGSCNIDQKKTSSPCTISAKARLYETCTANCWNPPVFECYKETGPSHSKEFIFRVVLEMEELPDEIFEFYGEARARKKEAAEHAAEGALWYLKHEGYLEK